MSLLPSQLRARRQRIESDWQRLNDISPRSVAAEIAGSWQRSRQFLAPEQSAAPLLRDGVPQWQASALGRAAAGSLDELTTLAAEGGMVAALSDAQGQLLWTSAGRVMRRRAERVHFVPGGSWHERDAGTNALALALVHRRPVTVFSAEHFVSAVHDWVCYAAPVCDPASGQLLGVVDLSTTWNRHNPLGQAAVTTFAQRIANGLTRPDTRQQLQILALAAQPVALWQGHRLPVSPRQLEILCLLALHPDGLDLQSLHAHLYGDQPVSLATLKTELSQLRQTLDGGVGSRPYRLTIPFCADFLDCENALSGGRLGEALTLAHGSLLPRSEAPALAERRHYLDAALDAAIWACQDTDVLCQLTRHPNTCSAASERLLQILPVTDPRRPALQARLATQGY